MAKKIPSNKITLLSVSVALALTAGTAQASLGNLGSTFGLSPVDIAISTGDKPNVEPRLPKLAWAVPAVSANATDTESRVILLEGIFLAIGANSI